MYLIFSVGVYVSLSLLQIESFPFVPLFLLFCLFTHISRAFFHFFSFASLCIHCYPFSNIPRNNSTIHDNNNNTDKQKRVNTPTTLSIHRVHITMSFTDTIDVDIVPPLSSIQTTGPTNKGVQPCRACGQLCMKRNGPLVKALGEIYHYQCFVCEVQLHSCLLFLGDGKGDME